MAKIAVIGAGPAGCAAAYRLHQRGNEVVLFDAAAHVGGRTYSYRDQGYHLDTGAGFFTNFYPTLLELLNSLGHKKEIIPLDRTTALIHNGQIGHLKLGSIRSYSQYPFLPLKDKLKMATHATQLTATRYRYNLTDVNKLEKYDDQSTAEYVLSELSDEIYNFIVRPGIEPFWYFRCEEVSKALYLALTCQAIDAKFFTLRHGMDTLCRLLCEPLKLLLSKEVVAVTKHDESQLKVSWISLESQEGTIENDLFDKVVIATTASRADAISEGLDTDYVTEFQRQYLQSQRYAANIHASFLVEQFPRKQRGASLFPCGPGKHPIAAIGFNSLKSKELRNSHQELISIYLSGEESERLLNASEEEINQQCYATALKLFSALPIEATPFFHKVRPEAIPIPEVGRYKLSSQFYSTQKAPILFAGDYLTTPTVEGALVSGEKAAALL